MTDLIFVIIGSAAFGITFAELSGIPNAAKRWQVERRIWVKVEEHEIRSTNGGLPLKRKVYRPRRIKPFDCHLCLSFWACLLICHFAQSLDSVASVLAACCSAVFSVWVWNKIKP